VLAPAATVAPRPPEASWEAAAAFPIPALTAAQALDESPEIESGGWVVVNGAGGVTGGLLVQLAAARGARVIATASAKKAERVRDYGASEVLDYHGDWPALVREITGGGALGPMVGSFRPSRRCWPTAPSACRSRPPVRVPARVRGRVKDSAAPSSSPPARSIYPVMTADAARSRPAKTELTTKTASACDVPTGRREMLTGSSIRSIPSVHGRALVGPPRLQAIPATATTIAATNNAPDKPRRVVATSTPVTTAPTASPPTVWMSSSRNAVAMWVSPVTGLLSLGVAVGGVCSPLWASHCGH
jgi:zinc-binding dehydrogenase